MANELGHDVANYGESQMDILVRYNEAENEAGENPNHKNGGTHVTVSEFNGVYVFASDVEALIAELEASW